MYFSEFPKIYYDFPNASGNDTFLQVLTDITANVRVRKQILEDVTLYDEYDIKEGETPEIIAEKIYGNPEYHWIIMLANQRYDYIRDFPLTSEELHQHILNTYGEDKVYNVHHYEQDGLYANASGVMKIPSIIIKQIKLNDFIINEFGRGRVESINLESSEIVLRIDYGRFTAGQLVSLHGIRLDLVGSLKYTAIDQFVIPTNGFSISSTYTVITNYDYETIENEKKRRIKIISPKLIEQILREYKSIMG